MFCFLSFLKVILPRKYLDLPKIARIVQRTPTYPSPTNQFYQLPRQLNPTWDDPCYSVVMLLSLTSVRAVP